MSLKVSKIIIAVDIPSPDFTVYDNGRLGARGDYPKRGDVLVSLTGEDTKERAETLEVLLSHLADYYECCAPKVTML